MKPVGLVSAGVLFLLLGTVGPLSAQQEQREKEAKPPQQGQQAKPDTHQQQAQPPRQEQQQKQEHQPQKTPQQPHQQPEQGKPQQGQQHQQEKPVQQQHQQPAKKPAQTAQRPQQAYGGAYHGGVKPTEPTHGGVHPSGVPQHQGQVRSGFQQSRATSWNADHRSWTQRGGYSGYRIPDDRFKLYFGRDHFFRISALPLLYVGGYPRFQYDGYWVTFVDPWPETWPATWYETDEVYLDYTDDGYYLYDRNHPGIGIAVTISF
jgi:hypothetical protein